MKWYKVIIRGLIHMPWIPTDEDLKIMDCYYESPAFSAPAGMDIFDILDYAYDRFFPEFEKIRFVDTVEIVTVG